MLVHWKVTASVKFAGTHLYTWMERGTMIVKCFAQEQLNVPNQGLIQTTQSGDERTNHEATEGKQYS